MNHSLQLSLATLLLPLAALAGDAAYLFSCAPTAVCVDLEKGGNCGKWDLAKLGWVRANSEDCTVRRVHYDAGRRLFWAVVAGDASSYSVIAFTLDPPQLVHRIRLQSRLEAVPNLVIPPAGERLWLAYQLEGGSRVTAIPFGGAESTAKLPAVAAVRPGQPLSWFSPYAEWHSNGISDLLNRVSVEDAEVRVQTIAPKPAAGCTEPVVAYAARAGSVLLRSPARQKPATCLEWFDPLASRRPTTIVPGPVELRHVAVSADGAQALVWSDGALFTLQLGGGKLARRASWKPDTPKSSAVALLAAGGAALLRDGYKLALVPETDPLREVSGVRAEGQTEFVLAPVAHGSAK